MCSEVQCATGLYSLLENKAVSDREDQKLFLCVFWLWLSLFGVYALFLQMWKLYLLITRKHQVHCQLLDLQPPMQGAKVVSFGAKAVNLSNVKLT